MYSASIVNKGDLQYHAATKDYRFLMGEDGGNPIDVLLASLCACVGHHVRDRLVEQKIAFSALTVKADGSLAGDKLSIARIAPRVRAGRQQGHPGTEGRPAAAGRALSGLQHPEEGGRHRPVDRGLRRRSRPGHEWKVASA